MLIHWGFVMFLILIDFNGGAAFCSKIIQNQVDINPDENKTKSGKSLGFLHIPKSRKTQKMVD